ncbi:MAG: class I SAM-dependent methyltransferase [Gammaproteobacteria bacterium]
MNQPDREKWNRIYSEKSAHGTEAAAVLREQHWLLPATGRALDLACGRGANAILLAERGLQTWAWDIADTVIDELQQLSAQKKLAIHAEQRDVCAQPPERDSFDVIVVTRFLERGILPAIAQALRPQGLLFYQTFIREKTTATGPDNPDYLLQANELLQTFSDLHTIYYMETGRIGDPTQGHRNEAMLIAQRR